MPRQILGGISAAIVAAAARAGPTAGGVPTRKGAAVPPSDPKQAAAIRGIMLDLLPFLRAALAPGHQ